MFLWCLRPVSGVERKLVTYADIVAGIGCLSALYACVYVCACVSHSKTKTTGHIVTKLGKWIVHDKFCSPIFEVERSNVKVGVS